MSLRSYSLSFLSIIAYSAVLAVAVAVFPTAVVAEEAQRTIRTITFQIKDIFDKPKNSIYETVNNLKIGTQHEVIRKELLFTEGDPYDQFLVLESERVLRQLRYLRNASIEEIIDGDFVDIIVHAQETWTIIPQVSYSSGDGRTRRSVGLAESNFLGYGQRVEVVYREDEGSDTIQAVYDSRNFLGTKNQLLAAFFDGNDGTRGVFEVGNPYRSLVQRSGWGLRADVGDTLEKLWENGDERFVYGEERERFNLGYSFAAGDPELTTHRLSFGYEYLDSRFHEADDEDLDDLDIDPTLISRDPTLLAEDRRFSGPWIGYESIEQDFVSMNYIDRFSRIEDYNVGETYATRVFFAPEVLGSRGDTAIVDASYSHGYRFSPGTFLRGEVAASTRADTDGLENSILHFETKVYSVLGPVLWDDWYLGKHTIAFNTFLDYAEDLDNDKEFLVGAQAALRGYKARTFTGDKRFGTTLEDRIHLIENAFDLVSIGAAVFVDAGGATTEPLGNLFSDHLYADIGLGLRFAFPRASGERVFRIDLAFPLREGPDGSDRFELRAIFSGGQIFGSRLATERQAAQRASVEIF